MCVCSRRTYGRQRETLQSLLFLPLHGLWDWAQVIRSSWREHLPVSHLVGLLPLFLWSAYFKSLRNLSCSALVCICWILPLHVLLHSSCLLWENSPLYFLLLRVVMAEATFKLPMLNALHSWDWLWTLGSVPPEGLVHVVARFPAPSRDCVRFVVRLQCVTDWKSLRSKSP